MTEAKKWEEMSLEERKAAYVVRDSEHATEWGKTLAEPKEQYVKEHPEAAGDAS